MFSIVYITAGNLEEARKIACILIEEQLAACANIFPIHSIFRWKDKIDESEEYGMIIKTRSDKVKQIENRVKEIHSYEIPCVVSFKLDGGSQDFLMWINACVE